MKLLNLSNFLFFTFFLLFLNNLCSEEAVDIWKKQKFLTVLKELNQKWKIIFISRPLNYLPKNKEFTYKIKIKIVSLIFFILALYIIYNYKTY